jgi:hypothetical protein
MVTKQDENARIVKPEHSPGFKAHSEISIRGPRI